MLLRTLSKMYLWGEECVFRLVLARCERVLKRLLAMVNAWPYYGGV